MKKNLSKLFALALALIMAMALAVPAFAQDVTPDPVIPGEGTGSITISNATKEETYSIYKVFDATYKGTGDTALVSYTIEKDSKWHNAITTDETLNAIFKFTPAAGSTTKLVVSLKEGKAGDDALKALQSYVKTNSIAADASAKANDATVKFSPVPFGYYLVKSTLNDGGTVTVHNVDSDVTVIDKNQNPIPETEFKTATDTTVEVGEITTFTIEFTTTNYDGNTKITEYNVKDTMVNTMEMVEGSLKVKVGTKDLVEDTDYTGSVSKDGFDIDIKWVNEKGEHLYASPNKLTITYSAKLLATANIAGEGNANSAQIGFNGTLKKDDTEKLYTYALAIKKVNLDGEGLAGATFELKNGDKVLKVSESTGTIPGANYYVVDPNGVATITSPENGLIVIKGVDSDTYTLTEKTAPAGYNLLENPVSVESQATSETTIDTTIYLDENGDVVSQEDSPAVTVDFDVDFGGTAVAVLNKTGSLLPSTGGMGTTIFYTLGGLLAVGAAVLLVTKKRVHDAEK